MLRGAQRLVLLLAPVVVLLSCAHLGSVFLLRLHTPRHEMRLFGRHLLFNMRSAVPKGMLLGIPLVSLLGYACLGGALLLRTRVHS